MKIKYIILLGFSSLLLACVQNGPKKQPNTVTEEVKATQELADEEAPVLVGTIKRDTLLSPAYSTWFKESYGDHTLDKKTIGVLKKVLEDVRITVFMGTWCDDSQREVPAFLKILDQVNYEDETVKIIGVSEDKTMPEKLVTTKKIQNVPTFIFSKDGKELGRIVEYPLESLEKDMVKILSGQAYKHAYAD